MENRLAVVMALSLGLYGCESQTDQPLVNDPSITETAAPTIEPVATDFEPERVSGIDFDGFDRSVRPQDDLFDYANGTWVRETEIPADQARWGSFNLLRKKVEKDVKELIDEVSHAENLSAGSAAQKIRDYYNTYMDTEKATALGVEAIRDELDQVAAAESLDELVRLFGLFDQYGVTSPFSKFIFVDQKDSDSNVVYLNQAGITLPDRDYYLKDDEQFIEGRALYLDYVTRLFELGGISDGAARAQALLALEHAIAEAHWTREEFRDAVKSYNPMSTEELNEFAPGFNWDVWLEASQIAGRDKYVVGQPSYFATVSAVFRDTPLETWKDYLAFQVLDRFAPVLGENYFKAWFDFYKAGLEGREAPRELWQRAIASTNSDLGELLGQLYVEQHYDAEAKTRMDELIANLLEAYQRSISSLDWMGEETRQQALVKLTKFTAKVGYPQKWQDYSKLVITDGDLIGNIKAADTFENNHNLDKLDHPVDRSEWFLTPQTINAYYAPGLNEIVFPAAILQPPFFHVDADDAVNYGAIGAIIGHEIGHGFDDQGRKYDGDGNLRDWWTEEDSARFEERRQRLANQYAGYEVVDGLTVNGEFTSGENIGDLGGLGIAYQAYRLSLDGQEAPVIEGLTGDQRFFIGWAQAWRTKSRDAELKRRLTVDPHSPPNLRANGAAVNVDGFYEAFDVKEGDGMWLPPEERVKIW